MNINFKLMAYFGGFAFVFSFLISLISGADFLAILLRSFFGGISFAILGAGIGYVIDRFLPGLNPFTDSQGEEEEKSERPEEVDITLPEENPHDRPRYVPDEELETEPEYSSGANRRNATYAAQLEDAGADTTEMDENIAGAATRRRQPVVPKASGRPGRDLIEKDAGNADFEDDEHVSGAGREEDTADGEESVEVEDEDAEVTEAEAGDWDDELPANDKVSSPNKAKKLGQKIRQASKAEESADEPEEDTADEEIQPLAAFEGFDVDSLPNVDSFESSFTSAEPAGDQADSKVDNIYKAAPGSSRKNLNLGGTEHNPDEAAKAIRTWLKKDKEG